MKRESGQMAIEAMVVLPVVLIVAVIVVNVGTYLSECAAFDRAARNAVRVYAASPEAGERHTAIATTIEEALQEGFSEEFLDVSVAFERSFGGKMTYRVTLTFHPTLFGMGLKTSVFGIPLPTASHEAVLTIDSYKPGILF